MKKALILGALAGQVDAIEVLKARGVETHACGHVAKGPGVEAADDFHMADITDFEEVLQLAKQLEVDLVYSVGSDIAMPTVVHVSERLGLPHFHGVQLTDLLRRKQALRDRLDVAQLSPVRYAAVAPSAPVPEWDTYPCIVKPVDAQGQRGISIVASPEDLVAAVELARSSSVSGPVIIEEYLVGPEVSAHVLVKDGEVQLFLPSDRHVWVGPMVGVAEGHSLPLRPETAKWEQEFRQLVESIVAELGVREGPLYVQTIFTETGPKIVEIASRLDGCHLWRLIKMSTGIDLMDTLLGRLLGDPWPELPAQFPIEPMTLEFFLDSPDAETSEEKLHAQAHERAIFVQAQLEDGRPRRTNDVVARLGYQIYPGI